MALNHYIQSGAKQLRCGYTTGSCAAAAAKAAVLALFEEPISTVTIETPADILLELDILDMRCDGKEASCAVKKDAGDDIDATDGILVYASVLLTDGGEISIEGGQGVGRVTKAGLEQPVGAPAINRAPRLMIAHEVRAVLDAKRPGAGARVIISVPGGERIASHTYNPRLGIEGGISILGTTGIVRPMSRQALIDTIYAELSVHHAAGDDPLLVTPGNYGETFCRDCLNLSRSPVLCSNFIGDALDHARALGFRRVLLVGHVGKLVKLAAGIFQTHSDTADARVEIFAAHAALAGADAAAVKNIFACITADEALAVIEQAGLLPAVCASLAKKTAEQLKHRCGEMQVSAVVFSNVRGILYQTPGADDLLNALQGKAQ